MVVVRSPSQLDLPSLQVLESASEKPFLFIEALKVDSIFIALD